MIATTLKANRIVGVSPTTKFTIIKNGENSTFIFVSSSPGVIENIVQNDAFHFESKGYSKHINAFYDLSFKERNPSNLLLFLGILAHTLETSLLADQVLVRAVYEGYFEQARSLPLEASAEGSSTPKVNFEFFRDTTSFPKMKSKVFTYLVLELGFSFPIMDVLNFIIEKWGDGLTKESED